MLVDGEVAGSVLTVMHVVKSGSDPSPISGAATSLPISLDLVADVASYALAEGETVPVEYGSLYGDVEGVPAQLVLNGTVVRTGEWASVYDVKPAITGVLDVVHRLVDNGVVTGTVLRARIEVTSLEGEYVLPELENPTPEEIRDVLVVARDTNLVARITNATEYAVFRGWSGKVRPRGGGAAVGAAGVMAASHAWLSHALASETLVETVPTDSDLTVVAFEPNGDESVRFDFTVRVEGVEVGGAATTDVQKEILKGNLKQIFGLDGGASLEESEMSSANVDIVFDTPEDGRVKFTAGPKDADAKTFFMKVKVIR